ncbi:acetyl-CoA carboxylase biotin carboxyl carrier protein [Sphingomicrobium astaxanthinifaciens]|nr:acetyl-CoA carboxylase biotin carboxyl carrier protein [Sphingomicrobium astaxanthinifaciens]MCJ7421801.1 acetyl-CoA carboxylase biotin carboxyl carrier protein [Sphingomicrobium astaxanthinifaciens]
MRVDSTLVRELAELLSANELTEIEVEDGNRKIRVSREKNVTYAAAAAPAAAPAPAPAPAAPAPAPAPAASDAAEAAPAGDALPQGTPVLAPMVGTAYMAAEPGAAPFITEGASVKEGDTLLIVEAMKVMNPITAPCAGTVKKIMVADAQPVEFDQPLVIIG